MVKKLILLLCIVFAPFSWALAYQNEPNGYASLYWGENLSNVKKAYNTSFMRYNKNRTGATYMVFIPNARGELGMLGAVGLLCYFDENNRLSYICIPIPRPKEMVESVYQQTLKDLSSICGKPTEILNDSAVWNGNTTMMAVSKREDAIEINLMFFLNNHCCHNYCLMR